MNFEEAVQGSSVIRQEHKETLVSCLKKIPEFSWLVGMPNSGIDRLQGDFVGTFPVVYLKPDGTVAHSEKTVMLVNNSCDLTPRSRMVTVAPVFDLERYLQSLAGQRNKENLANLERDIRSNQVSELLFVPDLKDFPNGAIVRLDMMSTVAAPLLEQAIQAGRRVASFTQNGFYVLLMKLTFHMTRAESAEVERDALPA